MAAFKIGHGLKQVVEGIQREQTNINEKRVVKVDHEFAHDVLTGKFPSQDKLHTLYFLLDNRCTPLLLTNCTDFKVERRRLLSDTQGYIQQFALKHNVSFSFLDPYLGLSGREALNQWEFELVSEEVDRVLERRVGPRCLALFGAMYGDGHAPLTIPDRKFRQMLEVANEIRADTGTLLQWYRLDDLSQPSVFELKSPAETYKYYRTSFPAFAASREDNEQLWQMTHANLHRDLVEIAGPMHQRGLLTKQQYARYAHSMFHQLLSRCMGDPSPEEAILFYQRIFQQPPADNEDISAFDYFEFDGTSLSKDANKRMHKLHHEVKKTIPQEQTRRKTVTWHAGRGLNVHDKRHKAYLNYVLTQTYLDLTRRISAARAKQQHLLQYFKTPASKAHFLESSAHLVFAHDQLKESVDREEVIDWIFSTVLENRAMPKPAEAGTSVEDWFLWRSDSQAYAAKSRGKSRASKTPGVPDIWEDEEDDDMTSRSVSRPTRSQFRDDERVSTVETIPDLPDQEVGETINPDPSLLNTPFFIHGDKQSGKTLLMCSLLTHAPSYLRHCVVIPRFVGATEDSLDFTCLLDGVSVTLAKLFRVRYKQSQDRDIVVSELTRLLELLSSRLLESPVLLLLDGLYQLEGSDVDYATSLKWVPRYLPEGLTLIISVDSCNVPMVNAAKQVSQESWRHFELPNHLSVETINKYLEDSLCVKYRGITEYHHQVLLKSLSQSPTIMFLDLLTSEVKKWRRDRLPQKKCFHSIEEALEHCFVREAQKTLGLPTVMYFCAYLSAARYGLTESELQDLLSWENEVLEEAYLFTQPPQNSPFRLPTITWLKLKSAFKELLTERRRCGKIVLAWKNEIYAQFFRDRFLAFPSIRAGILASLAGYFSGTLDSVKALKLRRGVNRADYLDADRLLPPAQPTKYKNDVYNTRKIKELPPLYAQLRAVQELHGFFYHYETLNHCVRALGVKGVIDDLNLICESLAARGCADQSLLCLAQFLESHRAAIGGDSHVLAMLFNSQPITGADPQLAEKLKMEAVRWFKRSISPLVLPLTAATVNTSGSSTPADFTAATVRITDHTQAAFKVSERSLLLRGKKATDVSLLDVPSGRMLPIDSPPSAGFIVNVHVLQPGLIVACTGQYWQLLHAGTLRGVMEDGTVVLPSAENSPFLSVVNPEPDIPEPTPEPPVETPAEEETAEEKDEEAAEEPKPKEPSRYYKLYSFKRSEWLDLPAAETDAKFIVPFLDDKTTYVVFVGTSSVLVCYEKVEWVVVERDEDEDEDLLNTNFAFGSRQTQVEEEEEEPEVIQFKENEEDDDFVAVVTDAPVEEEDIPLIGVPSADLAGDNDEDVLISTGVTPAGGPPSPSWKKVKVLQKKEIIFDSYFDPTVMPVLFENFLMLRSRGNLVLIDILTRESLELDLVKFFSCDAQRGLFVTQPFQRDLVRVYSVADFEEKATIKEKVDYVCLVPTRDILVSRDRTCLKLYSWDEDWNCTLLKQLDLDCRSPVDPQVWFLADRLIRPDNSGNLRIALLESIIKGREIEGKGHIPRTIETSSRVCCFQVYEGLVASGDERGTLTMTEFDKSSVTLRQRRSDVFDGQEESFAHIFIRPKSYSEDIFCVSDQGSCMLCPRLNPAETKRLLREGAADFIRAKVCDEILIFILVNKIETVDMVSGLADEEGIYVEPSLVDVVFRDYSNYLLIYPDRIQIVIQGEERRLDIPRAQEFVHHDWQLGCFVVKENSRCLALLSRTEQHVKKLIFKTAILDCCLVTQSKMVIAESQIIHTVSLVDFSRLLSVKLPRRSLEFSFSPDCRVGVSRTVDGFLSVVNTLSGDEITATRLPDLAPPESRLGLQCDSRLRIVAGTSAGEQVVLTCNPATEHGFSRIQFPLPEAVKGAQGLASEFAPLAPLLETHTKPCDIQ